MFQLSICAETIFCDLPLVERARKIAAAGFSVDFWRLSDATVDALASEPAIRISSFTGYMAGSLVHPNHLLEFVRGIEKTIAFAARLNCRDLVLSTGEIDNHGRIVHAIADNPIARWITAYKGLSKIGELATQFGVTYHLEPLNTKVDHAGYPLAQVDDAICLIDEVGSPRIKLLLDIYHTQIQEGNVTEVIRRCGPRIGYVHVADVPGRHEPGTGEINYPRVARALSETGYHGTVALEAYPAGDPYRALASFRDVFGAE